jgi:6-phosphogluconolactonase
VNLNNSPRLQVLKTPQEAARVCASFLVDSLDKTLQSQPHATIAISGGSTPRLLFSALATADVQWSKVHFFWVDERCVPPTDSQSNYKLAEETLLAPARVPAVNVHRIFGESDPGEAATQYASELRRFFKLQGDAFPVFDIIHRGMGADAHTASLFPGSPLIEDRTHLAAHVWVEHLKMDRVTLLPGVLEAAKCTVLQVSGEEKKQAVCHVLTGEKDPLRYPCQIASRDERAVWFLDEPAASLI